MGRSDLYAPEVLTFRALQSERTPQHDPHGFRYPCTYQGAILAGMAMVLT